MNGFRAHGIQLIFYYPFHSRLRIQAGLAPLGEETEETMDEDQVAYNNYQQLKEEKEMAKKAKEVQERIEKYVEVNSVDLTYHWTVTDP